MSAACGLAALHTGCGCCIEMAKTPKTENRKREPCTFCLLCFARARSLSLYYRICMLSIAKPVAS